jgi:hypothetical protein
VKLTSTTVATNAATVSNGSITLDAGGNAATNLTLTGNNDSVVLKGNDKLTASGTGISVDVSGGSNIATVAGTAVTLEAGAGATVSGNNNTVTALGSSDSLTLAGTGDTATISSGTVVLGAGASATVNGDTDTISETGTGTVTSTGSNHVLNVSGAGNKATLAGGTVNVAAGGALTLTGDNFAITQDNGGSSVVTSGNGISLRVKLTSTTVATNAATVSNGSIALDAGGNAATNLTLTGNNDSVVLKGNDKLTASGTGISVDVSGGSNIATLTGGSIILEAGTSSAATVLTLTGNNDSEVLNGYGTLTATGSGHTIDIYGTNNTVTASNASIVVEAGASVTVTGAHNTITYKGPGSSSTAITNGSAHGIAIGNGLVDFATGVTSNQIWFAQDGNDLHIDVLGSSQDLKIAGWFSGGSAQISSFDTADGRKLDSQLSQLVSAMATYSANHTGFDPTSATQMPTDSTLQSAISAAWHA